MTSHRPERSTQNVRPLSEADLRTAALRYLARFATTEAHLMQVLLRKIKRGLGSGAEAEQLEAGRDMAVRVAASCQRMGLVDDRAYAMGRARRLQAEGRPLSRIARDLAGRGVGAEDVAAALASLREEEGAGRDLDFAAAATLARRRKLGPYQIRGDRRDPVLRRRAFGVFARAGFPLDLARRVLDAESVDALDALLDET
ncbi:regulatory protein RecX [Govanella unica]|uniref:RecX family transcriptional regulator n=1 Tax=Govanella unica TaxID=2975056 RepID=A0A9X3TX75_9PROT|nr:RecX family transcriptional regulator [Govania unica]MDA5193655.1 RecX family transcriptional regulator [Govania unica]